jgi:hypothetical protein
MGHLLRLAKLQPSNLFLVDGEQVRTMMEVRGHILIFILTPPFLAP